MRPIGTQASARERLAQQLARYHAVEPSEARHHARMRALLDSSGDPFDRARYDPGHFTASAFVLSPTGNELLLIHHGKLGIWVQPGGHVDDADVDLQSAAAREVMEETGVSALEPLDAYPFDLDVHAIPARGQALSHEHFDVRFLFRASGRELQAGSDARAARWASAEQTAALGTDDSVLRAVRKLHGKGLLG